MRCRIRSRFADREPDQGPVVGQEDVDAAAGAVEVEEEEVVAGVDGVDDDVEEESDLLSEDEVAGVVDGFSELSLPERESVR